MKSSYVLFCLRTFRLTRLYIYIYIYIYKRYIQQLSFSRRQKDCEVIILQIYVYIYIYIYDGFSCQFWRMRITTVRWTTNTKHLFMVKAYVGPVTLFVRCWFQWFSASVCHWNPKNIPQASICDKGARMIGWMHIHPWAKRLADHCPVKSKT